MKPESLTVRSPEEDLIDYITDVRYSNVKNHILNKYRLKAFVAISGFTRFKRATDFQSIINTLIQDFNNKEGKSQKVNEVCQNICRSIALRYRVYENYPTDFRYLSQLLENPVYLEAKYDILNCWKLAETKNINIIQHLLKIFKINLPIQNYINITNPNFHEVLNDFFRIVETDDLCVFVSPFGLYLGGGEFYFLKLVNECFQSGRKVMIINPTPLADVLKTLELFDIDISMDTDDSRFYYFQSTIRIADYFQHNQFALYFEMGNKSYPTVMSKGKFSIFHSQFPFNHREKLQQNIKKRLESYDIVLANSYFTANSLGKIYHHASFTNIPFVGVLNPPTVSHLT